MHGVHVRRSVKRSLRLAVRTESIDVSTDSRVDSRLTEGWGRIRIGSLFRDQGVVASRVPSVFASFDRQRRTGIQACTCRPPAGSVASRSWGKPDVTSCVPLEVNVKRVPNTFDAMVRRVGA